MNVREKLLAQNDLLEKYIFERETEIRMMNHIILTRNHSFYIGDPGCTKSMMVDMKRRLIHGIRYFYKNCHTYIKTSELVGPEDILKFKQSGLVEFIVDNHLVMADIAMLDEVFKAHKQLSALLTVINERIFPQDTNTIVKSPLMSCFMASNELPGDKELTAFYNRILFKFYVESITDFENQIKLVYLDRMPPFPDNDPCSITLDELKQAQNEVLNVNIPRETAETLVMLSNLSRNEFVKVSDRQIRWLAKPVQAEAWLNGRTEALPEDCEILKHCLWNDPHKERDVIFSLVNKTCNQQLDDILTKLDTVIGPKGILADWRAAGPQANHKETAEQIRLIKTELEAMKPSEKNKSEHARVLKRVQLEHKMILPFAVKQIQNR